MKNETVEIQKIPFRPLKKKLLYAVILISTVFTSVIIFLNFKFEYIKDIKSLDEKIQQLNESTIPAIVKAAWNEDRSYLKLQADSIAKLKDVEKVIITDSNNEIIAESDEKPPPPFTGDLRSFKYPLSYGKTPSGNPEFLGNIQIIATTAEIRKDIYTRAAYFIAAQIIKTILFFWVILFVLHHYINKNIEQIINFIQTFNLDSVDENQLKIERKIRARDEFNILQDSINRMIKKIQFLNREKEKKISEQELKLEIQKKSAINNSKLAALGEVAGGFAHEINNPLTIIQAKTKRMEKMIEDGLSNNEMFLNDTKAIMGTVDRISHVIKGLKKISKDASDEIKQDAILSDLLSNVLDLCVEKFKNHHINLIVDMDNPFIKTHLNCFPVQLSQVFLILLNNSFEAIDKIKDEKNKWIRIDASQNKKWLFLHFIDSGEGIEKHIRDKIFQPFFTTKEVGRATGLGLSLAYEIIKKHGGEIFYDEHYENTCFTIKLLLKERKSIMVVDDDIDIRELICNYLQNEGYNTIEANNGIEALKIIKEKQIEFVISDIHMPDGGGLYLLDELRKIDRFLPYVILVTGQNGFDREEAIKRGALDLLRKPLDMDRIIGLIKYIENSIDDFIEV